MISPVLGMWLLGVGAEAKRVLTVPKRFFRKSLQINRLVNRGGSPHCCQIKRLTQPEDRTKILFVCPATRFREFV